MILVLAEPTDIHADAVMEGLRAEMRTVRRLHPFGLVQDSEVDFSFYFDMDAGASASIGTERPIDAHRIEAVFCRSYDFPSVASTDDFSECLRIEERKAWLHAFFGLIPRSRWFDSPEAQTHYDNKLLQIELARRTGLKSPTTSATTIPAQASEFIGSYECVIKQLSDVGFVQNTVEGYGFYTEPVSTDDLKDSEASLALCPVLLQARVRRIRDVRVTYVAGDMFAAYFDAGPYSDESDIRRVKNPEISIAEVPPKIACGIRGVMRNAGLRFAAFDFGIDEAGNWIFFEFNVTGNWLWIEDATGLPITNAIVRALLGITECMKP